MILLIMQNMGEDNTKHLVFNKEDAVEGEWIESGATIVGGCCRTTPKHIKKINQMINN